MPEIKRQNERLISMLVVGIIALNFPILSLFNKAKLIFGIPILYLYIFFIWLLLICCLALVLEKAPFPSLTAPLRKTDRSN